MREKTIARFRPQRVRIPHHEPVTVAFGSKRVVAPLSKLSVTGGVMHLSADRIQESFADITIPTAFGPVCGPIEFLATTVPGQLHAAAFRFFNIGTTDRARLQQTIGKMLNQGFGGIPDTWFRALARRICN